MDKKRLAVKTKLLKKRGKQMDDKEHKKLIQNQLILLLHAAKCARTVKKDLNIKCTVPHCDTMKKVLEHLRGCSEGRACKVHHCASSRQIIAHWKQCIRKDCEVCQPLKEGRRISIDQLYLDLEKLSVKNGMIHY